jgi:hypothetical protein
MIIFHYFLLKNGKKAGACCNLLRASFARPSGNKLQGGACHRQKQKFEFFTIIFNNLDKKLS